MVDFRLMQRLIRIAAVVALLAVLAWSAPAGAVVTCGGTKACVCGATVVENAKLTADIGPCPSSGLKLMSGVTLDCQGHRISGTTSRDGITATTVVDVRVRNCLIEGFRSGVRVVGGRDAFIGANVFRNNVKAIRIEGGADSPVVDDNVVQSSKDTGLAMVGAVDAVVSSNVFAGNAKINARIERVNRGEFLANVLAGPTKMDLDVRFSKTVVFRDNDVQTTSIKVSGDSTELRFVGNDVAAPDIGYRFEVRKDASGVPQAPRGNVVTNGSILNAPLCFRFSGARDTEVEKVGVRTCAATPYLEKSSNGLLPSGNTVRVQVVR